MKKMIKLSSRIRAFMAPNECTGRVRWKPAPTIASSCYESLAGALLFLTGFTVVNFGGAPMVDALSFLFLAAAIVCSNPERYGLTAPDTTAAPAPATPVATPVQAR